MIHFTKHAQNKFKVLARHRVFISEAQVRHAVESPELIDHSRSPLLIAQSQIDTEHVLRVVYKQEGDTMKIITFYPGRAKEYGNTR
ncbi:MAG: DUF4258 domain-containing protein [Parcubacteria group bacterium]|nr:DUF4258 domain-containing protein [Parcubacteria group bacterium]